MFVTGRNRTGVHAPRVEYARIDGVLCPAVRTSSSTARLFGSTRLRRPHLIFGRKLTPGRLVITRVSVTQETFGGGPCGGFSRLSPTVKSSGACIHGRWYVRRPAGSVSQKPSPQNDHHANRRNRDDSQLRLLVVPGHGGGPGKSGASGVESFAWLSAAMPVPTGAGIVLCNFVASAG